MGRPRNCLLACCPQVCSARVDIRSGNLYWLACNRRDIGVTKVSDLTPRILHRARSSIQHLFLDWRQGALYWLAHGQPLQQLSLSGGSPRDAWNETWPGDLPAAMDSKAFSLLWSSALGEPHKDLEQGAEEVALQTIGPFLLSGVLWNTLSCGWAPVFCHGIPAIMVCYGSTRAVLCAPDPQQEKFLLRMSDEVLEQVAQKAFKKCRDVAPRDMV